MTTDAAVDVVVYALVAANDVNRERWTIEKAATEFPKPPVWVDSGDRR